MNQDNPLVSILTPTWNRSELLDRVWNSLNNQTYQNIEWIVADDGSTDDTIELIKKLASHSSFPVKLIISNVHIGKARMDNESIDLAKGKFILWCDSDDYLLPHAVQRLVTAWRSIPEEDRDEYVGITALCATREGGAPENPFPNTEYTDVTWNDLTEKHGIAGDMLFFTLASALKENHFPEVDLVIPEGVVWKKLGEQKTRLIPEALKIIEYQSCNSISFSDKMEYNRGRAYAQAITARTLTMYPRNWKSRYWQLISFIRYSVHGEISLYNALRLWGGNSNRLIFMLMIPFALALAIKDELQGKVRKTHREFLEAIEKVEINIEHLNKQQ